jgi:hypothetical protein
MGAFDLGKILLPAGVNGDQAASVSQCPFVLTPRVNIVIQLLNHWEASAQLFRYHTSTVLTQPAELGDIKGGIYMPDGDGGQSGPTGVSIKSDDASTPVHLWDDRIWDGVAVAAEAVAAFRNRFDGRSPLEAIREFGIRYWRRRILCSLLTYLRESYGARWFENPAAAIDRSVGVDCVWRAASSSWWEWSQGSTLYFWRWPPALRSLAWDGHPLWVQGSLPTYRCPQRSEGDKSIRIQVAKKLSTVRMRRYIAPGRVSSLTN